MLINNSFNYVSIRTNFHFYFEWTEKFQNVTHDAVSGIHYTKYLNTSFTVH